MRPNCWIECKSAAMQEQAAAHSTLADMRSKFDSLMRNYETVMTAHEQHQVDQQQQQQQSDRSGVSDFTQGHLDQTESYGSAYAANITSTMSSRQHSRDISRDQGLTKETDTQLSPEMNRTQLSRGEGTVALEGRVGLGLGSSSSAGRIKHLESIIVRMARDYVFALRDMKAALGAVRQSVTHSHSAWAVQILRDKEVLLGSIQTAKAKDRESRIALSRAHATEKLLLEESFTKKIREMQEGHIKETKQVRADLVMKAESALGLAPTRNQGAEQEERSMMSGKPRFCCAYNEAYWSHNHRLI